MNNTTQKTRKQRLLRNDIKQQIVAKIKKIGLKLLIH